jgi:hypothetical protein
MHSSQRWQVQNTQKPRHHSPYTYRTKYLKIGPFKCKKHPTKKTKKQSRKHVSPPPVIGILKVSLPRIRSSMLASSISDEESRLLVAF